MRVALSKFHVSSESLESIFNVTNMLYKRYNAKNRAEGVPANEIVNAILEILSDGLRAKARVPSSTLASIAEVRKTRFWGHLTYHP